MSPFVFCIVLCGALCHATWNAVVKGGGDKMLATAAVAGGASVLAAVALPLLPLPAPAAWPFLIVSSFIQIGYFVLVARAYQVADMSLVYPLMRGVAPLLVALFSSLWLGEHFAPLLWGGMLLLCGGILSMAFSAVGRCHGLGVALLNAVVIATYTVLDGIGVRLSEEPLSYAMWVFLLSCLPFAAGVLVMRRTDYIAFACRRWPVFIVGGAGTVFSYTLALWAMTVAPYAVVAALRETAILFGLLLSALFLGERIGRIRWLACVLIVAGVVLMRLD